MERQSAQLRHFAYVERWCFGLDGKWRPGHRFDTTARDERIRELSASMPMRAIAKEVGCSVGTVHRVLHPKEPKPPPPAEYSATVTLRLDDDQPYGGKFKVELTGCRCHGFSGSVDLDETAWLSLNIFVKDDDDEGEDE